MFNRKIKSLQGLKSALKIHKKKGRKIAFTNGCFDLLHSGHVHYLHRIKNSADILVVGLNSDKSVRNIKGMNRPFNNEKDRAIVLSGLQSVDYVIIFEEDTPLNLIKNLRPDILVKGADWQRKDIVGNEYVRSYGGRCIRVPFLKGYSTSKVARKIAKKIRSG